MDKYYDEETLFNSLDILDHDQLILFAVFCAERLLPNYQRFSREESWGNPVVLRRCLDAVWLWLETGHLDPNIRELLIECNEQSPDTSDFHSLYVSAALDASTATANTLQLLEKRDVDLAIENGSFGRDTVDLYIQEIEMMDANSPELESRIRLHPLMQSEIAAQFDAIEAIAKGISINDAKQRWRALVKSNLELS